MKLKSLQEVKKRLHLRNLALISTRPHWASEIFQKLDSDTSMLLDIYIMQVSLLLQPQQVFKVTRENKSNDM